MFVFVNVRFHVRLCIPCSKQSQPCPRARTTEDFCTETHQCPSDTHKYTRSDRTIYKICIYKIMYISLTFGRIHLIAYVLYVGGLKETDSIVAGNSWSWNHDAMWSGYLDAMLQNHYTRTCIIIHVYNISYFDVARQLHEISHLQNSTFKITISISSMMFVHTWLWPNYDLLFRWLF